MRFLLYIFLVSIFSIGSFIGNVAYVNASDHCTDDDGFKCPPESDVVVYPDQTIEDNLDPDGSIPSGDGSPVSIPTSGDGSPVSIPTSGDGSPVSIPNNDRYDPQEHVPSVPVSNSNSASKSVGVYNPIEGRSIEDIFNAILDIILVFAIPIIVFFVILAGFKYVTAQGNETKISEASKALLYAVIGGVIVLGAKVLLAVITNTIKLFT